MDSTSNFSVPWRPSFWLAKRLGKISLGNSSHLTHYNHLIFKSTDHKLIILCNYCPLLLDNESAVVYNKYQNSEAILFKINFTSIVK